MKKFYLSALLVAMTFGAGAQTKLDLGSRAQLRQLRMEQKDSGSEYAKYSTKLKSIMHVNPDHALAILKVDDDATVERLEAKGVNVMRHTLGFAFVSMPTDMVEEVAGLQGVRRMQLARSVQTKNKLARQSTGVDLIHSGSGLAQAYTGKGVVCGIVDTGLDPNHINFKDDDGNSKKSVRQQEGVNFGPHIKCPHIDVQLIFVFPKVNKSEARNLIKYMKEGRYKSQSKSLTHYVGANVTYAPREFHIHFEDINNPVPEIEKALQRDCYRNRSSKVKYVAVYISPIHKYASSKDTKECYYKIKELFLKYDIPTQCIDRDKMNDVIAKDDRTNKANFVYTLQNMGVAICAKLGGAPWLLDETAKKELVIGIGAFKTNNQQYIGAAFSFDNTGIFNDYSYFQKSEMDELVGAIKLSIKRYSAANSQPERIIIHYYKKMSKKKEFRKIENMLHSLNLNIPVYIVTINKTESEDIVLFDDNSTYNIWNWQTNSFDVKKSLMPYSGRWINLGASGNSHTYLLCNNTRYENERFSPMDGFPFPVKLNIVCPNRNDEIETRVIQQLIDQVYQFSRIYWKSVKQQGLPVTIKYPEMIAEIMPHFNDPTVYTENNCLWFL